MIVLYIIIAIWILCLLYLAGTVDLEAKVRDSHIFEYLITLSGMSMSAFIFSYIISVCIGEIMQRTTLRQRTIVVFVSYHHSEERHASEIADKLQSFGYKVYFNPMQERNRDEIVDLVRSQLRKSNLVVALAAAYKDSFANSEILSASILKKPIIIVAGSVMGLPHTALTGYPVFIDEILRQKEYTQLRSFINFLFHARVPRSLQGALISTSNLYAYRRAIDFTYGVAAVVLLLWFIVTSLSLMFIDRYWLAVSTIWFLLTIFAMSILSSACYSFYVVMRRAKLMRIARQMASSRSFTFDVIKHVVESDVRDSMCSEPLDLASS